MKATKLLALTIFLLALMLVALSSNTPTGHVLLGSDSILDAGDPQGGLPGITGFGSDDFDTEGFGIATVPCTTVGSSGVITESKVLNDSLSGALHATCISFGANNLFLDCAGFSMTGIANTGTGVFSESRSNVTVRNCNINSFRNGINTTITSYGFFTNNTIHNNAEWGIRMTLGSSFSLINDSQYFSNGVGGIYITGLNSQNNSIANNNITNNTAFGIFFNNTHHNTIAYNNITNNSQIGTFLRANSPSNVIYNNTYAFHREAIELTFDADTNIIRNNTIANHTIAINITDGGDSTVDNSIYGNWIWNNSLAHANTDGASNLFYLNTSGESIGNWWNDTSRLSISDSNGNEYGDTGAQYPYSLANSAFVLGSVADYGPIVGAGLSSTINLTASPNPVDAGSTLTFQLSFNISGATAYNVSVTFSYSGSVTYVSGSPTPTGPTFSEFLLGNLTTGSYTINVTTTVAGGASGTISNGANYTYYSASGTKTNGSVTRDTTVTAAATPDTGGGGGGGGGSGCVDVCVLGTGICTAAGRSLCVKTGVCTDYVPSPCATGTVCSGGACIDCIESWLCEEWSPCLLGYQHRSCFDATDCGTTDGMPALTKTCAILPVIELPSPIVPIVYGEPFAGTPVACVAGTTSRVSTVSASPSTIDISNAVPFGYDIVAQPFSLNCDGDELDVTLTVPSSYADLQVLKCAEGKCANAEISSIENLASVCGTTTLSEETKKESLGSSGIFVPEDAESFILDARTIDSGDILTSGRYSLSVGGTLTASIAGLTYAIPGPANPSLAVLGTPLVVDVKNSASPLPATITLPLPTSDLVEKDSIGVYALIGTEWTYLGGSAQDSGAISVKVADINKFVNNGRAIFATIGTTCNPCGDTEFLKAYDYPGARSAVILIHGAFSSKETFNAMIEDFKSTRQPFDAWTFAYPASKSLDEISRALVDTLALRANEYDKFYLVGHSAGGLVIQQALWLAYQRGDDLTRVKKAVLIGTPSGGSPAVNTIENTFNWLINRKSVARVLNIHSDIIQASVTGKDIPRVPGIDYQVIAGTRPYPFNIDLFMNAAGEQSKNDGIITIDSAQRLGSESVSNACKNYYELNLTHTDLIDNELGARVAERIISSDISSTDQTLLGYNKYVKVPVTDCNPNDQYMIVGKPLRAEEQYDPSGCACGNGWCGEGEDAFGCPGDCAEVFTTETFCTMSSLLSMVLLIFAITLAFTLLGVHYLKHREIPPKWLYAGEIIVLLVLAVVLMLFGVCGESPWKWVAALLVLAGFFTFMIFLERKHANLSTRFASVIPKITPFAPSAPVKAAQPARPRINLSDLTLPKLQPQARPIRETLMLTPLAPDHHNETEHQAAHRDIQQSNERIERISKSSLRETLHSARPSGDHRKAHSQIDDVNAELAELKRKLNKLGKRGMMNP